MNFRKEHVQVSHAKPVDVDEDRLRANWHFRTTAGVAAFVVAVEALRDGLLNENVLWAGASVAPALAASLFAKEHWLSRSIVLAGSVGMVVYNKPELYWVAALFAGLAHGTGRTVSHLGSNDNGRTPVYDGDHPEPHPPSKKTAPLSEEGDGDGDGGDF